MYRSVWTRHWPEFKEIYPHKFEVMCGPLDDEKLDEVKKLIACGKFSNGFQRHTCPDCMALMIKDTVYSFMADAEIKKLVRTHGIRNGYFKPYRRVVKPP
ncbi:MAG TPA: hypothetical protein PK514_00025 [Spirochaetota bacterium]|nr:hypothetical protein [Spirochaetota bacterium]